MGEVNDSALRMTFPFGTWTWLTNWTWWIGEWVATGSHAWIEVRRFRDWRSKRDRWWESARKGGLDRAAGRHPASSMLKRNWIIPLTIP